MKDIFKISIIIVIFMSKFLLKFSSWNGYSKKFFYIQLFKNNRKCRRYFLLLIFYEGPATESR